MCFDTFSVRARNLQHYSKTFIFTMNLNDLTIQRNIYFLNFHSVSRYQFWHSFLIGFGIDLGPIWHPVGIKSVYFCDCFFDELGNGLFIDLNKNAPKSGSSFLTVVGLNFHELNGTASLSISSIACTSSSWTSSTAIFCIPPFAPTDNSATILKHQSHSVTQLYLFTFDSPVISCITPNNIISSHASVVTVSGLNFGRTNTSATITIALTGSNLCVTTAWTSETVMQCVQQRMLIELGEFWTVRLMTNTVGTTDAVFTFDAPVLSGSRSANLPVIHNVPILGLNFKLLDFSPTIQMDSVPCQTTSWTTSTALLCAAAAISNIVDIVVDGLIGSSALTFSFDSAVISSASVFNLPDSQDHGVAVSGLNFGFYDFSPSIKLEQIPCTTSIWSSSTAISCLGWRGLSHWTSIHLGATIEQLLGTSAGLLTFDGASVCSNRISINNFHV